MAEPTPSPDAVSIGQLPNNLTSFGMVIDYLSRRAPFTEHALGGLAAGIRLQLRHGHHFAAIANRQLVGYAGWLFTNDEAAQAWMEDRGPLVPLPEQGATAGALTIVAADQTAIVWKLIRQVRLRTPGKRAYFKRGDAANRPARKQTVLNFSPGTRAL